MRRRRQLKLEKKLQQFRSKDGGPDSGTVLYFGKFWTFPPYDMLVAAMKNNVAC